MRGWVFVRVLDMNQGGARVRSNEKQKKDVHVILQQIKRWECAATH